MQVHPRNSAAAATSPKRRKISHDAADEETKTPAAESTAKDTSSQAAAESPKTFKDLGIVDELCDACESLGYMNPTPIQSQSIPLALQNRDIIGLAETGSGKTAAFALPILQALLEHPQPYFGLVLAPTRELAHQIGQQFEALGGLIAVRCAVIVGGLDMVQQAIALGKKPHIIVASPGRCKLGPLFPAWPWQPLLSAWQLERNLSNLVSQCLTISRRPKAFLYGILSI